MAQRYSKQREMILSLLQSRYDHPTCEMLYLDLKKVMPAISLATVYRNLRLLENEGKIRCIPAKNAEHFDGNSSTHYHLTCTECGRIIDIELQNCDCIHSLPLDFGGEIRSHSLMYFGLCPQCKETLG